MQVINKSFVINDNHPYPIVGDFSFSNDVDSPPLVIFCHGYKGYKDWGAWNLVAEEFVKNGFSFVKFNFCLNGGTVEDPIDFPDLNAFSKNTHSQELIDVDRVLKFLLNENSFDFNQSDVSIIGHSRGGGVALLSSVKHSILKKVCTWASVADYGERFPNDNEINDWKINGVRYVLNSRTNQKMPHKFSFYQDFLDNKNKLNIENAVKKINFPQLIVHGTLDQAVHLDNANRLLSWNSSAVLYTLRTNHTFGIKHPWESSTLSLEMKEVVEQTISFLKQKI